MQYYVISQKGSSHEKNEDCYTIAEVGEWMVFVVADGVGGLPFGEKASEIAVATVESELLGGASLQEAIKAADSAICEQASSLDVQMGSTIIVCVINALSGVGRVAHVGDSRGYVFDEELLCRTRDHTLVEELVELGVLTDELALVHPNRSRLSQALGLGNVEVSVLECGDLRGKRVVLCSDGVCDFVGDEELRQIVVGCEVKEAAQNLASRALELGSTDDITVVVVWV